MNPSRERLEGEDARHEASGMSGGTLDPGEVDYGDDSIVLDLTEDQESQRWLDAEPDFQTFDELSEREKDEISRRARDKLE